MNGLYLQVIESRDKSHDSRQDIDPSAQDAVRVSALVRLWYWFCVLAVEYMNEVCG